MTKVEFDTYYIPGPMSGCWLWIGSTDNKGYGRFGARKTSIKAHRLSYQLHLGPFDPSMFVCHKCDTPACVNPAHLFLGTIQDNNLDAFLKGRTTKPPLKERCKRGHSLVGDNILLTKVGRRCRSCAYLVNKSIRDRAK